MPRERAPHEGSIDQFRDGYRGRIMIDYRSRTVYGKTRGEVVRKLRDVRQAAERGVAPDARLDRITVKEAVEMWREANQIRCRPQTRRYYDQRMAHVLSAIGRLRLRGVRSHHLDELHRAKLASGMSANGVAKIRTAASVFFNWCIRKHLISTNPAAESERPRTQRYRATRLTAEQAIRLLQGVRDDRLGPFVFLALTTAMREGELLGLLWEDVDLDRAIIHVRHSLYRDYDDTVQGRAGKLRIGPVKTEDSRRTVPLVDVAVEALTAHKGRQASERLRAEVWDEMGLVFCTEYGTPLASWNVARRFLRPALERAECPAIRMYDLRHSSATLLRALDVPIEVISAILGHAGIQITLSTYVEILDETKRDGLKRLGDRLRAGGV